MCIHALPNALRCALTPGGPGVVVDIPETTPADVNRSARAWDGITSTERMSETGVTHGSSLACKTSGAIDVSDLGAVRAVASGHHLPTRRGIRVQVP